MKFKYVKFLEELMKYSFCVTYIGNIMNVVINGKSHGFFSVAAISFILLWAWAFYINRND